MANTIYASFSGGAFAEKAAGALLDYGVRAEDISLVRCSLDTVDPSPDGRATANDEFDGSASVGRSHAPYSAATAQGVWEGSLGDPDADPVPFVGSIYGTDAIEYDRTGGDYERTAKEGITTTTGADAGAGALKGLGWGAGLGILAGLSALTVPGIGLVLGGGALATALGAVVASAGAGAIAGAVTGYLKDQGMDEHLAASYESAIQDGGALLAVTVPSGSVDETTVSWILVKYGAGTMIQQPTRGYVA